ncbi:MAG TPA: hypothetical protein EYN96_10660 [Candidatus Hydrogenedentes bacterium]|nr:hypothetical protein [Candidatus Hydrogenedentota bacterium]
MIYTLEDRMPFDTATYVYLAKVTIRRAWLAMLVCMTIGLAQTVEAAPMDLSAYDPACGVSIRHQDETLVVHWKTPEGATELTLNLSGQGAVVSSIAVASGEEKPEIILRDADPVTVLTLAERDLKKQNGWTIFFDHVDRKPRQSGPLSLTLKGAVVRSMGQRCVIDLDGLEGQGFAGKLRFTLYAGCDLIHVQAVVTTEKDSQALLYDAGLTYAPDDRSTVWIGLDDKLHRAKAGEQVAAPEKVRHRTIAVETETGSVAIFPPPHRYFYPLDEAYNLGFTWRGNNYLNHVSGFGIGIRQDPQGDNRWVPWFNAPPETEHKLGVFWLPSRDGGEKLFERVKAYTHGDRFAKVEGYKTFTSHYHIEHTTQLIDAREESKSDGVPPALEKPEFVEVFKNAGVQIVHLGEFHNRLGRERRSPRKAFALLKTLHDECARLSDEELLLLPGEEPNVHLGGHWISFFPNPVMWSLGRPKGKPFVEEHPDFGRVYHVGSAEDVLELMEREDGLMWTAHPRIKSSTGYPDSYRDKPFFKSDRYLGGAWKAMPADLSRDRLGWRVLDLLDDSANWGTKKQIVGEVDIFQVDRTTEFYAHANINYLRLDRVPEYKDGWAPVLNALRDGAFFISTGEVLMPSFTVGGKASGETLKLNSSGPTILKAKLTWTFPMAFAEVIIGDGKTVERKRIDLSETSAYGEHTVELPVDLSSKTWVRFEAWDVAANGVISQPVWLQ